MASARHEILLVNHLMILTAVCVLQERFRQVGGWLEEIAMRLAIWGGLPQRWTCVLYSVPDSFVCPFSVDIAARFCFTSELF